MATKNVFVFTDVIGHKYKVQLLIVCLFVKNKVAFVPFCKVCTRIMKNECYSVFVKLYFIFHEKTSNFASFYQEDWNDKVNKTF